MKLKNNLAWIILRVTVVYTTASYNYHNYHISIYIIQIQVPKHGKGKKNSHLIEWEIIPGIPLNENALE